MLNFVYLVLICIKIGSHIPLGPPKDTQNIFLINPFVVVLGYIFFSVL